MNKRLNNLMNFWILIGILELVLSVCILIILAFQKNLLLSIISIVFVAFSMPWVLKTVKLAVSVKLNKIQTFLDMYNHLEYSRFGRLYGLFMNSWILETKNILRQEIETRKLIDNQVFS